MVIETKGSHLGHIDDLAWIIVVAIDGQTDLAAVAPNILPAGGEKAQSLGNDPDIA